MKNSWDLTHLYKNDDIWFKDYAFLKKKMKNLSDELKSIQIDAKDLDYFIVLKSDCQILIEKLYCYARRHLDINYVLLNYKEMLQKALDLHNQFQIINGKFEKVVIDNSDLIKTLLKSNKLNRYTRYFNMILRRKKHLKSSATKTYISEISNIKDKYVQLLNFKFNTVLIDGKEYALNRNNYNDLIINAKQENRKIIFENYTDAYKKVNDQIANLYIQKLKLDIKCAKNLNYNSLLEKCLFELELPNKILNNLIETVNSHLDIMYDYTSLRKKLTGLDEYHIYDTSVSICNIPKIKYCLKDATVLIKKSLNLFGDDYVSLIDRMFNEGWIDVFPKDNKRTMSFTCISYVGVPYVLLNFNGSINSVRTLAHEIGHAAHTYYSKERNSFLYFEFSYFLTEIVSKVNEILFNEYIFRHSKNQEEKKYVLNNIISSIGNSLFGQVMLTEFEHNVINQLENNKEINQDYLNNLYFELSKKYNGNDLEYDDDIKYGWSKIPHLIMQDTYYLYQYSIGTAVAINVAYRLLKKEEKMVSNYRNFLSLGCSVSILDALEYIGIDLTNNNYIEEAMTFLKNKIELMRNFY